jgi:hypothetical protein
MSYGPTRHGAFGAMAASIQFWVEGTPLADAIAGHLWPAPVPVVLGQFASVSGGVFPLGCQTVRPYVGAVNSPPLYIVPQAINGSDAGLNCEFSTVCFQSFQADGTLKEGRRFRVEPDTRPFPGGFFPVPGVASGSAASISTYTSSKISRGAMLRVASEDSTR